MKTSMTLNGIIIDKINGKAQYHNIREHDAIVREPIEKIKRLLDTHADFSRETPEVNYELIVAINYILNTVEKIEY